ncbi:hypothetical protein [Botrimarina hoheduenensis]|uniref:ABC-2 family transporter protein n=1 Tax=Botrimarina hoheduenensis TaxID=2528000 RepID=A0A5C5WDF6_9BACT|nr:hypothetical protein [Botrimarina hoheduenensis]TWT48537.1 ABC-2 family transporter protein [Botrimarina hoheduenensis]
MVLEKEVLPFFTWLLRGEGATFADGEGALVLFAIVVATVFVLALVGGFLVSLVRHGPIRAGEIAYNTIVGGVGELLRTSFRRVAALAAVAAKESVRRRVWVALVVFGLILLFASWYLKANNTQPARLYLSFVLTATTYLILLLSLLLAAFSLPADFRTKTLYTIVTKPVRAGDIVLGRMLGFTLVGTVLLAIMGLGSWVFVNGSLAHTHRVDIESLEALRSPDGESLGQRGLTSYDVYHKHDLTIDTDGSGVAEGAHSHTHQVTQNGDRLEIGPAEGFLRARVPQRGKLRFYDRKGVETARGISVGNEWAYRSFIQGATQAAAVWTFEGVSKSSLVEYADGGGEYLPVELIVRVYRSYKGEIERGIQGSIQLRNPDTQVKTNLRTFYAKDATIDSFDFANEQTSTDQLPITILEDLVTPDGRLEVIVQALDRNQYFGFAQADCYLRRPEGSPLWNFIKGYLSIWMQMVIVIAVAVTASTFLKGPIAMLFTVAFLVLGLNREFFVKIAQLESYGGGPVESAVRMVTGMNQMSPFDPSSAVSVMKGIDFVLAKMMLGLSYVLPDFSTFLGRVNFVAEGFSIPADALTRDLIVCLAYVVGAFVIGYFCLRAREVAK